MRRILLLVLLALALPTAASANSINCPKGCFFTSGTFQGGTISGSFKTGGSIDVSLLGNDSKTPFFSYDIGPLRELPPQECADFQHCFIFLSGTVTVKNTAGATLFTGSLIDGSILFAPGSEFLVNIEAFLPLLECCSTTLDFNFTDNNLTGGVATLNIFTPEPSALEGLLLGGGLIGLVEMARRKLQLGT